MLSLNELRQRIGAELHTGNLNSIQDFYGLVNSAGSKFLNDCDSKDQKRVIQMANPIFSSINDYVAPADLKGNKIIDLYPIQDENDFSGGSFSNNFNRDFNRNRNSVFSKGFSILENNGMKILRVNWTNGNDVPVSINDGSLITSDAGTWTISNATNLRQDNLYFVCNKGSIACDSAMGNNMSPTFNLSITNPIDLSTQGINSTIFIWVWIDTPTSVSNISLKIGSDSTNYFSLLKTTDFLNNSFVKGWNLISFELRNATQTGSVNLASITFLNIIIGLGLNNVAQTFRIDCVSAILGTFLQMEYYSNYLFKDVNGNLKPKITADNDSINISIEAERVFISLCSYFASKQLQGANSQVDSANALNEYNQILAQYKQQYKSEVINPSAKWYKSARFQYRPNTSGDYY